MARISDHEISHVMALARLKLKDDEKKQMTRELEAILAYVAECEKAPTNSPAGELQTIQQISNLKNVSRPDEITPSLPIEKVLQNAPDKKDNFIKVKQVFQ